MSYTITNGLIQFLKISCTISNLKKQYPIQNSYSLELHKPNIHGKHNWILPILLANKFVKAAVDKDVLRNFKTIVKIPRPVEHR